MAFHWFRKRSAPEPELPSESRAHFRGGRSPLHELRARVRRHDGAEYAGECLDVAVGGAALRFPFTRDPGLRAGELVELTIEGRARQNRVRTPARVVHVEPGGEQHWRYGLELVSVGDLYSQLDGFYAHWFTRRSSPRPRVPAEQRIGVRVFWGNRELTAQTHDVSTTGLCLSLTDEKARKLAGLDRLRVRFRLPGTETVLHGPAWIRHRTQAVGRILMGVELDFEHDPELDLHRDALRRHVLERQAELERWERAIGAA